MCLAQVLQFDLKIFMLQLYPELIACTSQIYDFFLPKNLKENENVKKQIN